MASNDKLLPGAPSFSASLAERVGQPSLLVPQILRQQHFCRHAGNQLTIRVVDFQLQADRLDIAFTPAYVALRGEVAFDGFEDHRAPDRIAFRQANFQAVAVGDVAALGFGSFSANPGVVEVDDGDDRRTRVDDLTLA